MTEDTNEKRKHKKIRAAWRHKEDGTYDFRPLNHQEYFTNYYHTKGAELIECPYCSKTVKRSYMYCHNKTRACKTAHEKSIDTLCDVAIAAAVHNLGEDSPIHIRDTLDK